jgi:hypothetical protein
MPKAGYTCLIRRSGVGSAVTSEVMQVDSGTTYRITNSARRAIDTEVAWHLKDGASCVAWTNVTALDLAFGRVTLGAPPTGTLTFNGNFLPMTTSAEIVSEAKSFTLSESSDVLDKTVFTSTSRMMKKTYGLQDASLSVDLFVNPTDMPRLATLSANAGIVLMEINSGVSSLFRGYGRIDSLERSSTVDGLVEATVNVTLNGERHEPTGLISGYTDRIL